MYDIIYHPKIIHDLSKIDRSVLVRIHKAIEQKLTDKPKLYGIRLRGELKEYWKLRAGDYRIVYKIENKNVFMLAIRHRKEVYKIADSRI